MADDIVLDRVDFFDPETARWELLPPMRLTRCGFASAVLDGNLFICGGVIENATQ